MDISVGCAVTDRLLHLVSNLYLKLFGLSFFVPMRAVWKWDSEYLIISNSDTLNDYWIQIKKNSHIDNI